MIVTNKIWLNSGRICYISLDTNENIKLVENGTTHNLSEIVSKIDSKIDIMNTIIPDLPTFTPFYNWYTHTRSKRNLSYWFS